MFRKLYSRDIFLKFTKNDVAFFISVLFSIASAACMKEDRMSNCIFLNAFEQPVSLSELTAEQGREDALKLFSQGKVVFVGGYLATGPITAILYGNNSNESMSIYTNGSLEVIIEQFGISNIKKVYLTKGLNDLKNDFFLHVDDGVVGDTQIERECYDSSAREYGGAFNDTMIEAVLAASKKEKR